MYDEPYEYTSTNGKIGNLTRKGDGYYYYDSTRKHAVRSVIGTGGSSLSITIRAKGTSYGGVWPSMSLRVNGAVVKTWTVNTTSYTNYTHSTTLSGNDVLEVAYTNDQSTRTLYVDYVIVNGVTIQAESGAMVYDQGAGSAAYDGFDVIAGRETLDVNGALRFVKGSKARNAGYDANGNMTSRLEDGKAYLQTYDSENRLTTVNNLAIGETTTFTYDGDGNRVKVAIGSTTTVYIGNYYEKNTSNGVITKYYYAAGQRVAMRAGSTLYYLFGDHLGSSSVSLRASDGNTLTQRYYPWGTIRPGPDNGLPTDYTFTGQKLDTSTGLMYYVARYYDPALGRFAQADTIIPDPGNPQALNRYSYTLNNPVKYTDPSGHWEDEGAGWEPMPLPPPPPPPLPPAPAVPPAPPNGDPTKPGEVGIEWLTGQGPRHHEFREGDYFTELLQEHSHINDVRARIASRVRAGDYARYEDNYSLAGLEGIPKYIHDYSNIVTYGHTGNLAVTYLGSYDLDCWILSVDYGTGTAQVLFHIANESTLASATHPPVLGYTRFWQSVIEPLVNSFAPSGPMSRTTQSFWWTESIRFK